MNPTTGAIVTTWGQQGTAIPAVGSTAVEFNQPYGIAVHPTTGNIYIAERGNNRVQILTPAGAFISAFGSAGNAVGQFAAPIGIAVDSSGNVYVTEHDNHRVQKFAVTNAGVWPAGPVAVWPSSPGPEVGSLSGTPGAGSSNGQFDTAYGIWLDSSGNVLVADGGNGRVQRFSNTGTYLSTVGSYGANPGQFGIPTGVFQDASGTIWVTSTADVTGGATPAAADPNNTWVSRFSSNGTFSSRFGGQFGGAGMQFKLPFSIVATSTRAYVADYYNSRIQVFDLTLPSTPAITSGATASATVGTAFTYQITASNAPTSYAATNLAGTGLTLDTTTGVISGTPTANGTITSQLTATSPNGTGAAKALTITVTGGGSPPTIAAQTASGTQNTAMSYQVVATGATSFSTTSTLPAGLSLSSAGVISGTPSASGSSPITVTATNANGSNSAVVTISIAAAGSAPVISSATTATATVGTAFSYQITASGSPTGYAATGLPTNGLSLNATTGLISGTPTAAGTVSTQLTATNSTGTSAPVTLAITVSAASVTPAVTGVTGAVAGSYTTGGLLDLTANFNTAVTVVGAPSIALTVGSATRQAVYVSGSGTSALVFRYTVAAGDTDTDGIAAASPIALNGGTIRNGTGTNATLTFTAPAMTSVLVDTTAPAAPVIAAISPGTAVSGGATTTGGTPTFTGTAEAGSTVTLTRTGVGAVGTAVATGGNWSFTWPGAALSAGTYAFTATARDAATNTSPASATFTVTVSAPPVIAPVVTNASITGQVGTAISAVQVQATNSPTSFSASGLAAYGLTIGSTGLITGTPTATASNVSVPVSATNSAGTGSATLTLNISAAPVVTPPPPPPVIIPPPPIVKLGQTITFSTPTSSILVGQTITLGATTTSGLPISYSLVSGSADLNGDRLTINTAQPVVVRASQAGNALYNAASSVETTFTANKAAQAVTFAAMPNVSANAGPITLSATSSAGLPITYTLVSGPATLNGNVLTLTGAAGTVVVRAAQAGNDIYAAAGEVIRSFAVGAIGSQIYMGTIGSDPMAASISRDNAKGILIARLAASGEAVVLKFKVNADGTFSATTRTISPASDGAQIAGDTPAIAAAGSDLTFNGRVLNGVLSGTVAETGTPFTANVLPATGSTASYVGLYTTSMPGSASGDTYIVVGPNGQAFAVAITPTGVFSGTGTVSAAGVVNVSLGQSNTLTATLGSGGAINGSVTAAGVTRNFAGLADGTERNDRLINLSSRLRVTGGDASRGVFAGFVISGSTEKQVLIRAVGPGLNGFGLANTLAAPRLQIFDGASNPIALNEGWSNSADISSTGDRVGAFKLANGSRDAAVVLNLKPGAYSAQVTSVTGNGLVLLEVYDAATGAQLSSQQLVNISTRGFVDTGDGQLAAGFVVTGNTPKRVLIRGIGPGLTQFLVPNVVADPVLKVFTPGSTVPIAQNDNWGTAQPVNANQVAATAAEIAAASAASGAFPLTAGSADAAIVITLMPGDYSAVLSGANNGTGAGLVEVYEIPNP